MLYLGNSGTFHNTFLQIDPSSAQYSDISYITTRMFNQEPDNEIMVQSKQVYIYKLLKCVY